MVIGARATVDVEKDVADQLTEANISLESINSIIWSHHHLDHIGDPSLFPKSTSLIVGPGFKANKTAFPGYPKNPDAQTIDDAFHDRELIELDFSSGLDIGGFPAIDFFDDGSFYILKAPGHSKYIMILNGCARSNQVSAHDHICALARTAEDKFLFLGGDAAHHPGEYRPTVHLPLPAEIKPSPFDGPRSVSACAGSVFETIHRVRESGGDYRTTPFYDVNPKGNVDVVQALESMNKMEIFDASPDVFVIIAHDSSVLDIAPLFPKTLTDWNTTDCKELSTWRFLKDFETAVSASKTA